MDDWMIFSMDEGCSPEEDASVACVPASTRTGVAFVGFGEEGDGFRDDLNFRHQDGIDYNGSFHSTYFGHPQEAVSTLLDKFTSAEPPPPVSSCDQQSFCAAGDSTPGSVRGLAPCLSDNPLLGSNNDWLESSGDFSDILDQGSATAFPNSPEASFPTSSFPDRELGIKSPMEIFREIEREAAKFSPPAPASPPESQFTVLHAMEVASTMNDTSGLKSDSMLAGAQAIGATPIAVDGKYTNLWNPQFTNAYFPGQMATAYPTMGTFDQSPASAVSFLGSIPLQSSGMTTAVAVAPPPQQVVVVPQPALAPKPAVPEPAVRAQQVYQPVAASVPGPETAAEYQVIRVVGGNTIVFPDGTSAVFVRPDEQDSKMAPGGTLDAAINEGDLVGGMGPAGNQPDVSAVPTTNPGGVDLASLAAESEATMMMEQDMLSSAPSSVASSDMMSSSGVDSPADAGAPRKKRPYGKGSYERKKMQNRMSSFRYRLKKKVEGDLKVEEYEIVANRNKELKKAAADLEHEIAYWKKFMLELKSNE